MPIRTSTVACSTPGTGRAQSLHALGHAFTHVRAALRSTATASCFGAVDATPHFVALEHEDRNYKYFFGELKLGFTFTHAGETHECVLVEYLWPDFQQHNGRVENDGVPLWTRYVRTKRALYEVRPVEQVIFVPHLVVPPAFNEPGPGAREYRVLNEDVYGNF